MLVGAAVVLVTSGDAIVNGRSAEGAFVVGSLAAVLGAALGAGSGGAAAALSMAALALVPRFALRGAIAGVGAAAGGGASTYVLIAAMRLLPAAPIGVPVLIGVAIAAFDAAVAAVLVRVARPLG